MLIKTIILFVLILINGFYSCCEAAYLSIDKIKLKSDKLKNKKIKKVENLLKDTNRFLATIQVAITFAGFLAASFAAEVYVDLIIDKFNVTNLTVMEPLILIIVTLILSYFTLLFGELIPKRIALSNPNKIAYMTSNVLIFTRKLFTPFVFILTKSVNFITNIINIKENKNHELTEDRIKKTISVGYTEGVLEVNETNILMNVFEFNDTTAEEVMTENKNVVFLELEETTEQILKKFKKYKFTKYPVTSNGKIVGILNIKDLIVGDDKLIKNVMKKPFFVKEKDQIDHVFLKMKQEQIGMMIIKDKGIITNEDIIDELVGNIKEELN